MNRTVDIRWRVKSFAELSLEELHHLLKLRVDVFVVEQQCAYAEIDGQDPDAVHVLGYNDANELLAYARILPPHGDGLPHIGRVVTSPAHRGTGLGKAVMHQAINAVEARFGSRSNALAAQSHLQRFYEELGYVRTSEVYDWDGIPHIDMLFNATA